MGTLLVANMAPEGLDVSHAKKLHPFFVPGKTVDAPRPDLSTDDQSHSVEEIALRSKAVRSRKQARASQQPSSDVEPQSSDIGEDEQGRKRQKTDASNAPSSGKKRGRPRKKPNIPSVDITNLFSQVNGVPSTSLANETPQALLPLPMPIDVATRPLNQAPVSLLNMINGPSNTVPSAASEAPSAGQELRKPTKVLKFNPKTGTIGSPPKPKPSAAETSKGAKSSKSPSMPSRVVTIKYGIDAASRERIGPKIEHILSHPPKLDTTPTKITPRKPRAKAPKSDQDKSKTKETHPLFLGKSKKAAKPADTLSADPKPPRATIFSSTPCSPRKQRPVPIAGKVQLPQFGVRSMGLRVPGARHPAWPAQGMAHVRGLTDEKERLPVAKDTQVSSRKSKGQTTNIYPGESVIDQLAKSLNTLSIKKSVQEAIDDYEPPPAELRLPEKHFESGRKLRQRIKRELRSVLPVMTSADSEDELLTASSRKPHPAVARLYNMLETNLSAFDKSQCEELPWAQKYAPICGEEILQFQEGALLKEWLQTLTVQSVNTGVLTAEQKASGTKPGSATKKKRKRAKLDGFVVSDGDEADFLPAVSDDEDEWLPTPVHCGPKKTVVRRDIAKDASRLTNAVVLSGPHGSGKTAAVYAVAKELGFEVFEINASSRRNGKDVMERIGDMTQNHLVQHNRQGGKGDVGDNADDNTAKDIKSGKQGTMTSFFKLKAASKPEAAPLPKAIDQPSEAPKSAKAKVQNQKQSLILLEEVDLLYEEDKQFWATIMNLVAQSKRPFVMTCNDETLVPFHNFMLYGILRFTPPPALLAVDVLLLVAANEGHALSRAAVSALYESKGNDLRASLMELNYWCQLGVGDRRGGFDWFYPRWPTGCDKDENGDVVRVVSEGTYLEGMGWISRDRAVVPSARAAEEELEPLDPTQPDLPIKTRDDLVLGRRLLEAPFQIDYTLTATTIATGLKCAARQLLQTVPLRDGTVAKLDCFRENSAIRQMGQFFATPPREEVINRYDMATAFDPIAVSEKAAATVSTSLEPSVFDRTMRMITVEVAPFVRSIISYDHRLMQNRMQRSGLLSEGGRPGKRMRSTRAAYSALEGVARGNMRKENYFVADISTTLVMRTAGEGWQAAVDEVMSSMEQPPSPVAQSEPSVEEDNTLVSTATE
ncbi:ATPase [Colletotrichum orchidophilum]|uniref:ATPase n=1 Tax=Colletotrichum orchidophilum TaxID=1209926 RepID=A0A1G4B597_9PEZI|nr:ATPase [Colletotrichum orchidophilum]OHE96577.1 ATPase [Colletotrichum orchidophilum]